MPTKPSSVPDVISSGGIKTHWPGLLWAFLILLLSTFTPPGIHIPTLFDLLEPDKVGHFAFYSALVFLLVLGFNRAQTGHWMRCNTVRTAWLMAILYGGLIELYQGFILTDRQADPIDFLADCIGGLLGILLLRIRKLSRLVNSVLYRTPEL
ncbi:MAG: VanZ family protein [Bacteroidota bacterium]